MTSSKPYQYVKGYTEFYKLKFKVTPDTLIPRPETELLVDEVLRFVSQLQPITYKLQPITILDLGTGAGNIAISLAKNLSHTRGITIIATDISKKALKVAKQNARLHDVQSKITFIQSDLLNVVASPALAGHGNLARKIASSSPAASPRNDAGIDIIVTNLPYIPTERIPYLDSSVKDFEPHVALDGGEDGFELYRKLFSQIKEKSWQPKLIIGEIDYTHGELAVNESQKYFPYSQIETKKDLARKQRILLIS
ncbi:MAG: peptide chain release factor N(5)-glutamine methyltransferase [Candidatus Daviesbacteria bacterium]|nr:peptide chain release factor N(5)-glutamine methyltransferase [Candidatus Daviesbacteria bacterium]